MEYVVNNRTPISLFRFFEEISAIPRGSFNEQAIADHLVAFANARGLECYRDEANNVLIKAPASLGMESRPPLLLQGHTDMVCEKDSESDHDFLTDPLKLYLDGKFLRARGTTLGADDGVAVAAMMALLDGAIGMHPAYECLFTTAEEVGLEGAYAFDYERITARRMINMDSEALGVVTAGCAGGVRSDLTLFFSPTDCDRSCVRVELRGLMGGHSGEDINKGRANANVLMGRILRTLSEEQAIRLVRINGGSKDNAIPRACEAILAVADVDLAIDRITELAAAEAETLSLEDRGFQVLCESSEPECCMMTGEDTDRVIRLLNGVPNGVLQMSRSVEDLVEFSRNMGVVRCEEGCLTVTFSSRSAIEAQIDASVEELTRLAECTGCEIRHRGRYPGWEYAEVSALRNAYLQAFEEVTGKKATVNVIHAGLECGVICSRIREMDIISVGPTMQDIHSPSEALDLDSTETFWRVLETLIPRL